MVMISTPQKMLALQSILIGILVLPFFKFFLSVPATIGIEGILFLAGIGIILNLKKEKIPKTTLLIYAVILILLQATAGALLLLPDELVFPLTLAMIVALSAFLGIKNIFQLSTVEGIVEESNSGESKIRLEPNYLHLFKPSSVLISAGNLQKGQKVRLRAVKGLFKGTEYKIVNNVN